MPLLKINPIPDSTISADMEKAIERCEQILSETLGFNVHCSNRSEVSFHPQDCIQSKGPYHVDWYQFWDNVKFSLEFEGTANHHVDWVDNRG